MMMMWCVMWLVDDDLICDVIGLLKIVVLWSKPTWLGIIKLQSPFIMVMGLLSYNCYNYNFSCISHSACVAAVNSVWRVREHSFASSTDPPVNMFKSSFIVCNLVILFITLIILFVTPVIMFVKVPAILVNQGGTPVFFLNL